jgi:hypothetical protein
LDPATCEAVVEGFGMYLDDWDEDEDDEDDDEDDEDDEDKE